MPDDVRTITLPGGIQVPIPTWTSYAFGVIAVLAIGFATYRYFYPPENERIATERDHYQRHMFEEAEATFTQDGISVRVYRDDCLVVARKTEARLLLSAAPHVEHAFRLPPFMPVVEAATVTQGCAHYGPMVRWEYGSRLDACWVEVHRTFQDGCQHVQHYNTCTGAWETYPNGYPVLRWIRCNH